jgi:hypothetical protein
MKYKTHAECSRHPYRISKLYHKGNVYIKRIKDCNCKEDEDEDENEKGTVIVWNYKVGMATLK